MRRLAAILLLIPLGILFIGAVNLSSVCPMTPQDGCTASSDHCCHKGKCGSKSESRKDHKTDRSACCYDCPLCALVTIPPFICFELSQLQPTIEYAVSPDNLLTDYDRHHWKPPDVSRLS
jgi:hypothetical protein